MAKAGKQSKFTWPFNSRSTALQVVRGVDLTGKCAVITGANTGIGFETLRALASTGCHVIAACRDLHKAQAAIDKVKAEFPEAKCTAMQLDLRLLSNVRRFADDFDRLRLPLHYLILNAGVWTGKYEQTDDQLEATFQTNHLSHFYLTQLLLKKLLASAPSRVVVVSSQALEFTSPRSLTCDTLTESWFVGSPHGFSGSKRYGLSKTLNALFAQELHRRLASAKSPVSVFFLHPGIIRTELTRNSAYARLLFLISRVAHKSREQGAATTVFCTCCSGLEPLSGSYFFDCKPRTLKKWLRDEQLAAKLWQLSEQLICSRLSNDKSLCELIA